MGANAWRCHIDSRITAGTSGYALYLKSMRPSQTYQTTHPFRTTIRHTIIANGTSEPTVGPRSRTDSVVRTGSAMAARFKQAARDAV